MKIRIGVHLLITFFLIIGSHSCKIQKEKQFPYQNSKLSVAERAKDLLGIGYTVF